MSPKPPHRPAKPPLSDPEFNVAIELLTRGAASPNATGGRPRGLGLRAATAAINRLRGADELVDPEARRRRTVSVRWLVDQLAARGYRGVSQTVGKVEASQEPTQPSRPLEVV